MIKKYVYHASAKKGLKELKPSKGTHGESWVYATKDKLMAVAFIGTKGGDYAAKVGRNRDGKIYITERFKGALKMRYSVSGSIYTLSSNGFIEGKTTWPEEVVSPNTVKTITEEYIDDVITYLKNLETDGEIIISYFPERYMADKDDSDIVNKAIIWTRQFGKGELIRLKKYHPELLYKVKDGLKH